MYSFFGGICRDVAFEILLFLSPEEVCSLSTINKEHKKLFEEDHVWREFFARKYGVNEVDKNVNEMKWKLFFRDFYYEGINWMTKPFVEDREWIIETDYGSKTASITKVGDHVLWVFMNRKVSAKSNVLVTVEIESEDKDCIPSGVFGLKWSESGDWSEWEKRGWSNSYPKRYVHNSSVFCMGFGGQLFHQYSLGYSENNTKIEKGGGRITLVMKDGNVSFCNKKDEGEVRKVDFKKIPNGYFRFFITSKGYGKKTKNRFKIIDFKPL